MKTTIRIDEDMERALERLQSDCGRSLPELLNEALRIGLSHLEATTHGQGRYETKVAMLRPCGRTNFDDVAGVLSEVGD